jgi:hypothetical protein
MDNDKKRLWIVMGSILLGFIGLFCYGKVGAFLFYIVYWCVCLVIWAIRKQ